MKIAQTVLLLAPTVAFRAVTVAGFKIKNKEYENYTGL